MVLYFYHGYNGLDGLFPMRDWEQNINQINPLERMEGVALDGMLSVWALRALSYKTRAEA